MRKSYYTKEDKSEIAFCMPINESDWNPNYKIVRQDQKRRSLIFRLLDRNFQTEEEAQAKLNQIAKAKGWKIAYES